MPEVSVSSTQVELYGCDYMKWVTSAKLYRYCKFITTSSKQVDVCGKLAQKALAGVDLDDASKQKVWYEHVDTVCKKTNELRNSSCNRVKKEVMGKSFRVLFFVEARDPAILILRAVCWIHFTQNVVQGYPLKRI